MPSTAPILAKLSRPTMKPDFAPLPTGCFCFGIARIYHIVGSCAAVPEADCRDVRPACHCDSEAGAGINPISSLPPGGMNPKALMQLRYGTRLKQGRVSKKALAHMSGLQLSDPGHCLP